MPLSAASALPFVNQASVWLSFLTALSHAGAGLTPSTLLLQHCGPLLAWFMIAAYEQCSVILMRNTFELESDFPDNVFRRCRKPIAIKTATLCMFCLSSRHLQIEIDIKR